MTYTRSQILENRKKWAEFLAVQTSSKTYEEGSLVSINDGTDASPQDIGK